MKPLTALHRGCLIALLLVLGAVGCQDGERAASIAPVKVGALFPITGDLADKGVDSANGVTLAVEEINAAGGIAALGGAKLAVIRADTRGQPDIGVRETERLIRKEGVAALIGTYQSSVTKPATQAAERLETPFIVSISIANIITEREFDYTFRIQPKADGYARDQVRFLSDLETLAGYRVRRVALLHENTDFGTSAALAQKRSLMAQGIEVVADIGYRAEGVSDLSEEVARVLETKPDVILTVTYLLDSILIRRALADAGATIPLLDTAGGTVSPEYIQTLGPLAEGTLTVAEFSKFARDGKKLNQRFHARFGTDITGDSAYAYQAVLVLQDALERSGSTDRKQLRAALAATDIGEGPRLVLPSERIRFDENGQNEFARLYVVQIQGGELMPVWPPEYAVKTVVLDR